MPLAPKKKINLRDNEWYYPQLRRFTQDMWDMKRMGYTRDQEDFIRSTVAAYPGRIEAGISQGMQKLIDKYGYDLSKHKEEVDQMIASVIRKENRKFYHETKDYVSEDFLKGAGRFFRGLLSSSFNGDEEEERAVRGYFDRHAPNYARVIQDQGGGLGGMFNVFDLYAPLLRVGPAGAVYLSTYNLAPRKALQESREKQYQESLEKQRKEKLSPDLVANVRPQPLQPRPQPQPQASPPSFSNSTTLSLSSTGSLPPTPSPMKEPPRKRAVLSVSPASPEDALRDVQMNTPSLPPRLPPTKKRDPISVSPATPNDALRDLPSPEPKEPSLLDSKDLSASALFGRSQASINADHNAASRTQDSSHAIEPSGLRRSALLSYEAFQDALRKQKILDSRHDFRRAIMWGDYGSPAVFIRTIGKEREMIDPDLRFDAIAWLLANPEYGGDFSITSKAPTPLRDSVSLDPARLAANVTKGMIWVPSRAENVQDILRERAFLSSNDRRSVSQLIDSNPFVKRMSPQMFAPYVALREILYSGMNNQPLDHEERRILRHQYLAENSTDDSIAQPFDALERRDYDKKVFDRLAYIAQRLNRYRSYNNALGQAGDYNPSDVLYHLMRLYRSGVIGQNPSFGSQARLQPLWLRYAANAKNAVPSIISDESFSTPGERLTFTDVMRFFSGAGGLKPEHAQVIRRFFPYSTVSKFGWHELYDDVRGDMWDAYEGHRLGLHRMDEATQAIRRNAMRPALGGKREPVALSAQYEPTGTIDRKGVMADQQFAEFVGAPNSLINPTVPANHQIVPLAMNPLGVLADEIAGRVSAPLFSSYLNQSSSRTATPSSILTPSGVSPHRRPNPLPAIYSTFNTGPVPDRLHVYRQIAGDLNLSEPEVRKMLGNTKQAIALQDPSDKTTKQLVRAVDDVFSTRRTGFEQGNAMKNLGILEDALESKTRPEGWTSPGKPIDDPNDMARLNQEVDELRQSVRPFRDAYEINPLWEQIRANQLAGKYSPYDPTFAKYRLKADAPGIKPGYIIPEDERPRVPSPPAAAAVNSPTNTTDSSSYASPVVAQDQSAANSAVGETPPPRSEVAPSVLVPGGAIVELGNQVGQINGSQLNSLNAMRQGILQDLVHIDPETVVRASQAIADDLSTVSRFKNTRLRTQQNQLEEMMRNYTGPAAMMPSQIALENGFRPASAGLRRLLQRADDVALRFYTGHLKSNGRLQETASDLKNSLAMPNTEVVLDPDKPDDTPEAFNQNTAILSGQLVTKDKRFEAPPPPLPKEEDVPVAVAPAPQAGPPSPAPPVGVAAPDTAPEQPQGGVPIVAVEANPVVQEPEAEANTILAQPNPPAPADEEPQLPIQQAQREPAEQEEQAVGEQVAVKADDSGDEWSWTESDTDDANPKTTIPQRRRIAEVDNGPAIGIGVVRRGEEAVAPDEVAREEIENPPELPARRFRISTNDFLRHQLGNRQALGRPDRIEEQIGGTLLFAKPEGIQLLNRVNRSANITEMVENNEITGDDIRGFFDRRIRDGEQGKEKLLNDWADYVISKNPYMSRYSARDIYRGTLAATGRLNLPALDPAFHRSIGGTNDPEIAVMAGRSREQPPGDGDGVAVQNIVVTAAKEPQQAEAATGAVDRSVASSTAESPYEGLMRRYHDQVQKLSQNKKDINTRRYQLDDLRRQIRFYETQVAGLKDYFGEIEPLIDQNNRRGIVSSSRELLSQLQTVWKRDNDVFNIDEDAPVIQDEDGRKVDRLASIEAEQRDNLEPRDEEEGQEEQEENEDEEETKEPRTISETAKRIEEQLDTQAAEVGNEGTHFRLSPLLEDAYKNTLQTLENKLSNLRARLEAEQHDISIEEEGADLEFKYADGIYRGLAAKEGIPDTQFGPTYVGKQLDRQSVADFTRQAQQAVAPSEKEIKAQLRESITKDVLKQFTTDLETMKKNLVQQQAQNEHLSEQLRRQQQQAMMAYQGMGGGFLNTGAGYGYRFGRIDSLGRFRPTTLADAAARTYGQNQTALQSQYIQALATQHAKGGAIPSKQFNSLRRRGKPAGTGKSIPKKRAAKPSSRQAKQKR